MSYEEDDDDVENPESAAYHIDPNNPLVAPIQAQIKEQLTKQLEELKLQKYEKSGEVKKASQEREEVGVELYSLQQDLANREAEKQQLQARYNTAKLQKDQSDEDLNRAQAETDAKKSALTSLRAKVAKSQRELDEANEELMKLKHYNDTVVSEIAVARRDAYHTDETLMSHEVQKKDQDYLVNKLEAELRSLQDQYSLLEAQVTAQQKETEIARSTLADANAEKEAVLASVRQLMLQANSASVGVQRRDEALQQTETALRDQTEQLATLNSEILGFNNLIKQEETKQEKQSQILSHVSGDQDRLKKRIEQMAQQRETKLTNLAVLKKSADAIEEKVSDAQHQLKLLQSTSNALQQKIQKVQTQVNQTEDKIMAHMDEQESYDKFTKSTDANRQKILEKVREKDLEAANVQNELERLKLDVLNTQAHTTTLQKVLDQKIAELKEKDAIIEKFEVEIRRKNDEISKKQSEVDKLNRKYDAITRDKQEEDMGPLEATIHNLQKEIDKKKEECAELERNWMRLQMSLLSLMKQNEDYDQNVRSLSAEQTVLTQRKLRLEQQVRQQNAEVKELKDNMKNMYTQMEMLNANIALRNKEHEQLASDTIDLESRFVSKMRELEKETAKLEEELEEKKNLKDTMTEDIVECERQVLLWNRKIELEKETQSTLDTAGTESELKEMEEEIHKMELRLDKLKKAEDEKVKRMKQIIAGRVSIAQKGNAQAKMEQRSMGITTRGTTSRSLAPLTGVGRTATISGTRTFRAGSSTMGQTKTAVKSQIVDLQRKTRAVKTEVQNADNEYVAAQQRQLELQQRVEENGQTAAQMREDKEKERELTNNLLMEKQKNLDKLTRCQRFLRRYESELKGTWNCGVKSHEDLMEKIEKEKDKRRQLDSVISALKEQFPFIRSLA